MGYEITMSSKGQVVIPKDVRAELNLKAGEKLRLHRVGRQIILEASDLPRERISYDEFRRRVPRYQGPALAVEDMTPDFAKIWPDRR